MEIMGVKDDTIERGFIEKFFMNDSKQNDKLLNRKCPICNMTVGFVLMTQEFDMLDCYKKLGIPGKVDIVSCSRCIPIY